MEQRHNSGAATQALTGRPSDEMITTSLVVAEGEIPISMRVYDDREKRALVSIYKACGGEGWSQNGRWITNPDPSTWSGVVVEGGHVTKLFLSHNNLTGTLPSVFDALPMLRVLNLNENSLEGEIPVSIGGLSKLECLDLSRNQFSGNIPRSLGGLFSLRRLLLDHNSLEGDVPSTLGCLSNLKWIDLCDNKFQNPSLPGFLDFIPVRRPADAIKF